MAGGAERVRRGVERVRQVRNWAAVTREQRLAAEDAQAAAREAQQREAQAGQPQYADPVARALDSHADLARPADRLLARDAELGVVVIQLHKALYLKPQHRADYTVYIGFAQPADRDTVSRKHAQAVTERKKTRDELKNKHKIDVRDEPAASRLGVSQAEIDARQEVPSAAALRTYIDTGLWPRELVKEALVEAGKTAGDVARFATRTTLKASDRADALLTKFSGMEPEQLIEHARERREQMDASNREAGKTAVDRAFERLERGEELTPEELRNLKAEAVHLEMEHERIPGHQEKPGLSPKDIEELSHPDRNRPAQPRDEVNEPQRISPDEAREIEMRHLREIEGLSPVEAEARMREKEEADRREAAYLEGKRQEAAEDLARQQREIDAARNKDAGTQEQPDRPADRRAAEEPARETTSQRREARSPRPGSYADRHRTQRETAGQPDRGTTDQGREEGPHREERAGERREADQPAPRTREAAEQPRDRQGTGTRDRGPSLRAEADEPAPRTREAQQPEPRREEPDRQQPEQSEPDK